MRSWLRCFIVAHAFLLSLLATPLHGNLLPQELLVVYNSRLPSSATVAQYYQSKRGIPAANLCPVYTGLEEWLGATQADQDYFTGLQQVIEDYLVTTFGSNPSETGDRARLWGCAHG